jgi:hypothetical protein
MPSWIFWILKTIGPYLLEKLVDFVFENLRDKTKKDAFISMIKKENPKN